MKTTTKLKINALLTIITLNVLGTTEAGAKIICWLGLFIEFVVFAMIFEKDYQC